jgi:hypothetical protein
MILDGRFGRSSCDAMLLKKSIVRGSCEAAEWFEQKLLTPISIKVTHPLFTEILPRQRIRVPRQRASL